MKRSLILVVVLFPLFGLAALLHTARLQASPPQSGGVTFTVNSTIDATDANPGDGVCETAVGNGECTLRAAVMETNILTGTDVINLPNGTYVLTVQGTCENDSAVGDLDIKDGLILNGENINQTVIDGNEGDTVISVFNLQPVEINNLSIVNGLSSCGSAAGGIINAGDVFLENVKIAENSCSPGTNNGIGIINHGTLHVLASVISNNVCNELFSRSVFNSGYPSELIITNTTITQNSGGIHNNGILTLTNSNVSENQQAGIDSGNGAAFIYNSTIISNHDGIIIFEGIIQNSIVIENLRRGVTLSSQGEGVTMISSTVSNNLGGGIQVGFSSIASIHDSRIQNNFAQDEGGPTPGGGIYIEPNAMVTITGSTISGNSAKHGGGVSNIGTTTIVNSTISENSATEEGGGIYNYFSGIFGSGTVDLMSSTIVSNSAALGSNIYNGGGARHYKGLLLLGAVKNDTILSKNHHLWDLPKLSGTDFGVAQTILAGGVTNCDGFPITSLGYNLEDGNSCGLISTGDITNTNPLLEPLQDNGGSTPTHALNLHSPAINSGNNSLCPSIDQRGVIRPQNGVCDIGAYEFEFILTAIDDEAITHQNLAILIDVLVNDLPGDNGDPLLDSVGEPMSGTAVISNTLILYTPAPDFVGTDTFTYTMTDGVLTDTAVVTVTVLPVDDQTYIYLPVVLKPEE